MTVVRHDEAPARLDTDDARAAREERSSPGGKGAEGRPIGARFAADQAGAAWSGFLLALAERGERLRRAVPDAGHGPEQARLAAAHFEAAAREERVWLEAAGGADLR